MGPKTLSNRLAVLTFFLCIALPLSIRSQSSNDQALAFDAVGDYIGLNLTNTPVNGAGDFTVEVRFLSNVVTGYNLLFSLTDNASPSFLTVGLIPGGQLAIIWQDNSGAGPLQPLLVVTNPANLEGSCHHLALSRQGSNLSLYLNGAPLATLTTFTGTFQFDEFRVGSDLAVVPGSQFWDGVADEIRLWSVARSAAQIMDAYDCVLSSTIPGPIADLEVYWPLDPSPSQTTTPGGPNGNPNIVAYDESGHLNHGTLQGFSLASVNQNSNFILSPCLPRYELLITDDPSIAPTLLTSICSGDAVHFGIYNNFVSSPIPGAAVNWYYSDDGGLNWPPVNHPLFNGAAFGLPKGVVVDPNCATSATGYLDRKYRAEIVKTGPNFNCTYTTNEYDLRICCPVTGSITLTPQPNFIPPASTLCEGTVTVDVVLNGPPFLSTLPIQWCVNGVPDPSFNNMTSFTYTGPANAPDLCFEAKIQNCACPAVKIQVCLQVDPMPGCGTIDQIFSQVVPDPNGGPYDYLICPGMEETLSMMGNFTNCNAVWQYHFDMPANDPWKDLSTSNNWQNTNTLPQYTPPNVPIWPAVAKCIYYRIECRPPNYPNSGCPNCTSNIVSICLQPDNLQPPVVTASPQLICENGTSILTSSAATDPNATQEQWYCNGLPFGGPMPPGSSITVSQSACYSVAVTDGCYTKFSNVECVTLCDPVAIIQCPEDNPCACLDMPITLDGTLSFSNCAPIVNYTWTITDCNGTTTQTGPLLSYQFTVPICTATFVLTVTDSNGCMQTSKPMIITPCE